MLKIEDLIDRFSDIENHEDCWDQAKRLISHVDGNAINVVSYQLDTNKINWVRSSMKQTWLNDYSAQRFDVCDPFLRFISSPATENLVVAGSIRRSAALTTNAYELNHQLMDAGYRSMVATKFLGARPNEGRMVVISSDQKMEDFFNIEKQQSLRRFMVITSKFLSAPEVSETFNIFAQEGEHLTQREVEVLSLLANGSRNDVIAHKMGVAEVTIRKHLLSVRKKLGVATREEALVKAILQGRIRP